MKICGTCNGIPCGCKGLFARLERALDEAEAIEYRKSHDSKLVSNWLRKDVRYGSKTKGRDSRTHEGPRDERGALEADDQVG